MKPGTICHIEEHRTNSDGTVTLVAATDGYKWTLIRPKTERVSLEDLKGEIVGTNFLDW